VAFAGDLRHQPLADRENLHDGWLGSVLVREDAGSRLLIECADFTYETIPLPRYHPRP
jgi:hypothetical protein